jgi:hypothetical protein
MLASAEADFEFDSAGLEPKEFRRLGQGSVGQLKHRQTLDDEPRVVRT